MSPQELVIRHATEADADAMGRLHVRAWQGAYRGVMPDEYLDGLQADERIAMWRGRIARTDLPPMLVAELMGEVVGFAVFGAEQPTDDHSGCGELYAMNIDPPHWGKGIGRAMLREVTVALGAAGHGEAVLWVVPENARARMLYESEGWVADGGIATDEILGVTVTDIRYRKPLGQ
ncbi:MAG: GNAT family N-acetyltransferase [Ilumatobacteraceae bacterium]